MPPIFTQWGVLILIIGTEIKLKEPDPGNAGGGSAIGNIPASLVSF